MINKAIVVGYLGADPDVRQMQDGSPVANFTLATSEKWKDKQTGEKRERSEWHRVTVFGPAADAVGRYLRKGSLAYVEGKLQTRKWQDKSGNDRYTTEIIVSGFGTKVQFLDRQGAGGDRRDDAPPSDDGQSYSQQRRAETSGPAPVDDFDDEVPF